MVKSINHGMVTLGGNELECHVLSNGQRVLSTRDFLNAFGINFVPGNEYKTLKPFLDKLKLATLGNTELNIALFEPIKFIKEGKGGNLPGNGYLAELLPEICNAILARAENEVLGLDPDLKKATRQSRKLLKSFANVGIIALIDEATGYQEYRDKRALQDILDKYLDDSYSAWAKRFPDDFYKQMFRLKKWEWKGMHINRPSIVGTYTKNIVYSRLVPGLLKELEERNPPLESGRRRSKHHQWLTTDVGHPALAEHLAGVIAIMKISSSWDQFEQRLAKVYPILGEQLYLDLDDDDA